MIGFLSPALLALGAAIAVPLVLHLLHRHQGQRVVFPALRYLRRAEKENARRIKLRQLLLLLLRVSALLLLALAAARPFLRRGGAAHEPAAIAIILDNSLSTSVVEGEERVLDQLQARALETLAGARAEDRFWVIRAASPWEPAVAGDAAAAIARVRETEVSAASADMGAALARARALLEAGAEGRAPEIHLLTDLQASAFATRLEGEKGAPPVIVWGPKSAAPQNAGITGVAVGGGIAPRAGERSTANVEIAGVRDGDSTPVRLVIDDRVSATASAANGSTVVLPFPARPAGIVTGRVEIDPDALRGDDRRYFAFRTLPPPAVAVAGRLPFADEALDVLASSGRIKRADPASADVLLAPAGAGLERVRRGGAVVVLPPAEPAELPAANRRLSDAGVPWRFKAPTAAGEARLAGAPAGDEILSPLAGARIRQSFPLERQGSAHEDSVLLRLEDGSPWAVRGDLPGGGRYLILASPLSAEASSLPTSPALLPLLDRLTGAWATASAASSEATPGESYPIPAGATAIERPDGTRDTVDADGAYLVPGRAGVYLVRAGDRVIDAFAVNPAPAESELARLDARQLSAALPGWTLERVSNPDGWARAIYRQRLGREVWRPVALILLALLLVEGLIAASGRSGLGRARAVTAEPSERRTRVAAGGGGEMGADPRTS